MMGTIQRIAKLLCTEPLTATEVANAVGTIAEDYGGNLQIVVRPGDAAFTEAHVTREYGTQVPSSVRLTLADPKAMTVAELRSTFGEYSQPPRLHYDSATAIVFDEIYRASPSLSCALIAEVVPGAHGVDDGTIATLSLRRDKL